MSVVAGYVKNLSASKEVAAAAVKMLVAMAVATRATAAIASLKQAIDAGTLGAALAAIGSDDIESRAFVLAGVLLASPESTPNTVSKKSNSNDQAIVSLLSDSNVDQSIIKACADIVRTVYGGTILLSNLASKEALYKIGERVFSAIVDANYKFSTNRLTLISSRAFLESMGDDRVLDRYFETLDTGRTALAELAKRPVVDSSAFIASRIYRTSYGRKSVALRNKLMKYLASVSVERWQHDIASAGVLFRMASDIRRLSGKLSIGVSGLDALINLVSSAGATPIDANRVEAAAGLLDADLRANLPTRLWSMILATGDVSHRRAAIAAADGLLVDMTGTDTRTAANTVLMPLIADPTKESADWMVRVVAANKAALGKEPSIVAELRARANVALRPLSGIDPEVKRSLRKVTRELPTKVVRRKSAKSPGRGQRR